MILLKMKIFMSEENMGPNKSKKLKHTFFHIFENIVRIILKLHVFHTFAIWFRILSLFSIL